VRAAGLWDDKSWADFSGAIAEARPALRLLGMQLSCEEELSPTEACVALERIEALLRVARFAAEWAR